MATDVVQVIKARLQEIDEQLAPLEEEKSKLTNVLVTLDDAPSGQPQPSRRPRSGAQAAQGRRARPKRGASSKRAKHGSNVQAIVEHISSHPGATTPSIAVATGIDRAVIYSALSRLSSAGRIRKTPREDGQVAYEVLGA